MEAFEVWEINSAHVIQAAKSKIREANGYFYYYSSFEAVCNKRRRLSQKPDAITQG